MLSSLLLFATFMLGTLVIILIMDVYDALVEAWRERRPHRRYCGCRICRHGHLFDDQD